MFYFLCRYKLLLLQQQNGIYLSVDNNKGMSVRAITINQSYESNLPNKHRQKRPAEIFPDLTADKPTQVNSLKSIATVLSQALSTKDHQAIRQLLVTVTPDIIKNTVNQLPAGRVAALLEAIQLMLIQQTKNMSNIQFISKWLAQILKKNIGHIISNPELQTICGRINIIIIKKTSQLAKLQEIRRKLISNRGQPSEKISNSQKRIFTPKFHYVEQEHQNEIKDQKEQNNEESQKGESDISQIGPEDLEGLDDMLMDDLDA